MEQLTPHELSTFLLAIAVLLGVARAAGELINRFNQPAIVGEILAGIILGPTVFGTLFPELFTGLFPAEGHVPIALNTMSNVAVVLLLLVAGLEIDLSILWRQGRAALVISPLGIAVPFGIGFAVAWFAPAFWGVDPASQGLTFALFFGVAMSISALPVIAKTLMDLGLFKTDIGMLIMAAAMFDDLVGWIIFSVVLGLMSGGSAGHALPLWASITMTLGLAVFVLTIGRRLVHKLLPWLQSRLSWPGGVLSFTLVLCFLGATITESIGIHAVFGAFLTGIAVGDSTHLRAQTRTILHQFVTYIFAPIFFVSIGLQVNFLEAFNLLMVLAVLATGFAGKLIGCVVGARLGGLSVREGWAIGFGMNARGAMEIILGLLALQYGLIGEEMFVALVVLALVSSVLSGPIMRLFIPRKPEWPLENLILAPAYVPELQALTAEEAIRELAELAAGQASLESGDITEAVLGRESVFSTALGGELAVPRARLDGIDRPVLAIGHSTPGIDFNAPDDRPVRLIFLLLTPASEPFAHLRITAQIKRLFSKEETRTQIYEDRSIDVLRALIKTERAAI